MHMNQNCQKLKHFALCWIFTDSHHNNCI